MIHGDRLAVLLCHCYHLAHENHLIIERNSYLGGDAEAQSRDGGSWD